MLTTFITPFGKYCYNVLPFCISPASEHYQKMMKENLSDCEGTVVDNNDILIHGADKKKHDEKLRKVLRRLQDMNMTLNPEKCKFARNQVPFLGHIIHGDAFTQIQNRLQPSQTRQYHLIYLNSVDSLEWSTNCPNFHLS